MLILFDHGAPRGLRKSLHAHRVYTAREQGWDTLSNGLLLSAAEEAGFDLLLTTDQRIRYQQNLQGRRIAILVLTGKRKWSRVRLHVELIAAAVGQTTIGSYNEIAIPFS